MSTLALRVLEHVHGHVGWLAVAALLHPAIILRRPRRRASLSVVLATLTLTLTGVAGVMLYSPYRNTLKQRIFIETPRVGWLFERKEHLAVGALALAWVGCVAHLTAPRFPSSARSSVERAAHGAFVAAAALAALTAVLGVIVAVNATF